MTYRCQVCATQCADSYHHHHFKYPKDWSDDSIENLIYVCSECHDLLHKHIEHDSADISLRDYWAEVAEIREAHLSEDGYKLYSMISDIVKSDKFEIIADSKLNRIGIRFLAPIYSKLLSEEIFQRVRKKIKEVDNG